MLVVYLENKRQHKGVHVSVYVFNTDIKHSSNNGHGKMLGGIFVARLQYLRYMNPLRQ